MTATRSRRAWSNVRLLIGDRYAVATRISKLLSIGDRYAVAMRSLPPAGHMKMPTATQLKLAGASSLYGEILASQ